MPETRELEDGLNEPTVDLDRVEVFRAGNYGDKGAYTEADLDTMAADYSPETHEAPITLDHAAEGPAYGWISNLWREGKSLFAKVSKVPERFADAVRNGRYKKRSAELSNRISPTGNLYLRAVSFLGAMVPVVKGMSDVKLASDESFVGVDWASARMNKRGGSMADRPASPTKSQDFPSDDLGDFVARFSYGTTTPGEDPDPSGHGILTGKTYTLEMLGHGHDAYVDADGNGFTDAAGDGHFHLIRKGSVEPAGKISHTHPLEIPHFGEEGNRMSEKEPTKDKVEEPKTETKDSAKTEVVDVKFGEKEIAEFKAQIKALQDETKASKDALAAEKEARRTEQETRRFAEAFDKAHKEGRVYPAEREALSAVFAALPFDEDKTIEFGEAKEKKGLRTILLDAIAGRPENGLNRQAIDGHEDIERAGTTSSDNPGDRRFAEAKKLMKENGWGDDHLEEALIIVSKKHDT